MARRTPQILAVVVLATGAPANDVAEEHPLQDLPYTPSLDPSAMDRSVDPCVDLYAYACGGWMKQNPIPPDEASWSVYGKLEDENRRFLWGILEEAAVPGPARDAARQKIGDHFASCMDEEAIEAAGAAPLGPELQGIASLRDRGELAAWLGGAHVRIADDLQGILFGFGAQQDFRNSERVIAWADAGGLGLPDRDDYLADDAKSVETRRRYVEHVATMLALAGDSTEAARVGAEDVMRIETALAKASLTRVEKRDPRNLDHRMAVRKLVRLTPSFRWADYLAAAGIGSIAEVNVTEPRFFEAVETALRTESLEAWRTYLRWHVVRARASHLSSAFVSAGFRFYQAHLRGVESLPPRWKRCVAQVDRDLGEALGKVFVEKVFPPEVKGRALEMTAAIEKAMEARVEALDWMGAKTRRRALQKLHAMRNKIGYPERLRDYASLTIRRGDYYGNVMRADVFETRRQLAKIGRPVDREEWGMTPPTVNAYYDPAMNDINFPAGVLLPPLYDPRLDDAPNYGNTGATIGHELVHGFDDEGSRFDAKGNLRDWWTRDDASEFERRTACVADQYAAYVVVDDVKINSRLTLGEDVADLGGTILAWVAWEGATVGLPLDRRDGLTPDQRFFVGFAQWACENERPENLRLLARTNPHSPGVYRINGVVANMPEFARAFACSAGAPLVKEKVCRVW